MLRLLRLCLLRGLSLLLLLIKGLVAITAGARSMQVRVDRGGVGNGAYTCWLSGGWHFQVLTILEILVLHHRVLI